jgi:hypothetical protein
VCCMGELRLYAIGIDEVRSMFGAPPQERERLKAIAQQALAPAPAAASRGGLITKLGPIFKRPPAVTVISPTQPVPQDVDTLIAGAYVPPERIGATWRVLETLVQGTAWGSTLMSLTPESLDDLDFALARGGVTSAVGLRHLLNSASSLNLLPVRGLSVGWHPHEKALAMAGAYRSAMPQVKTREQQEVVAALVNWLDGFIPWAQAAVSQRRPVPDLVGFWAN